MSNLQYLLSAKKEFENDITTYFIFNNYNL